jgi:hypothetical protein
MQVLQQVSQPWSLPNAAREYVQRTDHQMMKGQRTVTGNKHGEYIPELEEPRQRHSSLCTSCATHQLRVIQFQLSFSLIRLNKHTKYVLEPIGILDRFIQTVFLQVGFPFCYLVMHKCFDGRTCIT